MLEGLEPSAVWSAEWLLNAGRIRIANSVRSGWGPTSRFASGGVGIPNCAPTGRQHGTHVRLRATIGAGLADGFGMTVSATNAP